MKNKKIKLTFNDRKQFIVFAIKKHLGLLGIWLVFIIFGAFFAYLGSKFKTDGTLFMAFGFGFILLSSAFILFTLPSSLQYYYEQALTKKYGSYTLAKITNKRIDDYSHNLKNLDSSTNKRVKTFLYVIEFQFTYNNTTYSNECYFEHEATFNAITTTTVLPIKFLKTNPNKITVRRQKLSKQLGIKAQLCN